ncbi:claudin-4-like [Misgurnus anguillicaudatus]|uniref:claudin-4-like n=1 Tax=Misgurnus anguillicaudatus TaxID=75329 RepID=UPI003CCF1668
MQAVKSKKLGLSLAILGWIGAIVSCALPMWKDSVWIRSATEYTTIWEGIWERCEDSTGEMQCKIQDSMTLTSDLQAARPLCIVAIVMGVLGLFFSIVGAKCTPCVKEERVKTKDMFAAGGTFICAAILLLIPLCWAAYNTMKNKNIKDISPDIIEFRNQIGTSLYLGWVSTALLLGGGCILCRTRIPDKVIEVVVETGKELLSQDN